MMEAAPAASITAPAANKERLRSVDTAAACAAHHLRPNCATGSSVRFETTPAALRRDVGALSPPNSEGYADERSVALSAGLQTAMSPASSIGS